jgi:tetratricopeptide (TPR) repeat protein
MESRILSNPFPGLRPFEPDEDHLFFGREEEIDELLRRLRNARFLLVVGSSGTGKSSLVRSGLIPALQSGFMVKAGSSWRMMIFRPGDDPLGNLAAALDRPDALGTEGELASTNKVIIEATLRRSSLGIVQAVRQARIPPQDNILILVDQFEELFRFRRSGHGGDSRNEAVAFFKLLVEAAKQEELPIYVVLTMRSDFLGDCMEFQGLPEAVNAGLYLIPRMTRDELRSAITGPVAVAGGEIAQRLVLRLLNDLGDDHDQLPVLQHTLMRAWDRWAAQPEREPSIDLADYEAIGGLHQAMSLHAEEAYQEADFPRGHEITEKLFKALTDTFSDLRGVRRPTSIQELSSICEALESDIIKVVEIFRRAGRSFLTPHAGVPLESNSIVDLSHESLMRGWTRLIAWADEERESATTYMRIAQGASWCRECDGGGLWIDPQLETALQWRRENRPTAAWARRYDASFAEAMEFLDLSEKQRQEERAKEIARKRLRQIAIYVLTGLLLAIGTLTYVVYRQRSRAEMNLMLAKKAVDESLSSAGAQQSREAPDSPELEQFRRQLLDKAKTFYLNFARQAPRNEAIVAEMAAAHSRLGDIYRLLEMREDAVHEYDQAIAQFLKLSYDHPIKADYRQALAYCHNWLGETLRLWLESGNKPTQYSVADAEKEYDAAAVLQEELHRSVPSDPIYRQELARSYYNRGILRYDGLRFDEAKADFLLAAGLLQPLTSGASPTPLNSQNLPNPSQDLARVYNDFGQLYLKQEDFEGAAQLFEQAIVTLNALREKFPDNREYKAEAATYYNNLALALGYQHLFDVAGKPNRSALDIVQELAEPSPAISAKRDKILILQAWIVKHETQGGEVATDEPGQHLEIREMYLGLGRSYAQIARECLNAGEVAEAAQAIESMRLILPKLTPTERPELAARYAELRKELNDEARKER